jgi:gas vesicle protein
MNKRTIYLAGLITAAAAGAIAGLLLAPKKGTEFRKDIKDRTNEITDQLKELSKKGKNHLHQMKDEMQEAAQG